MSEIARKYETAFGPAPAAGDYQTDRIRVVTAGRLSLPSGRIAVCDPLVSGPRYPFVQSVLPGRFNVELALIRTAQGQEYVALARVTFTIQAPEVWTPAALKPARSESLSGGTKAGYRSESGTGAFVDADGVGLAAFDEMEDVDALLESLTANYRPHRFWLELGLDRRYNIIMFSSGHGEGVYPSYFGIGADGDVTVLVTDFGLMEE